MSTPRILEEVSDDLTEVKDYAELMCMATSGIADNVEGRVMRLGMVHLLYLVERLQDKIEVRL
ncbi:hypothetical protein C8J31_105130 [Rhizobium sp. PP-CC-2G-626]|nr:hypothetical protein C8J31_105130 [Rhizobium sp. PP-CC-2G-626]